MTETFGKYHIHSELGKGGFATVYRAVDTTLDREVALKVLDPLLMRDATWAERFRREAKTIATLKHPAIVSIYEVNEVEGRLYLAMELAAGGSLAGAIAARGRLPWADTLALLKPVCEALDYAHGQGVIHRDLKPANILLTAEGQPLLTDFGFARLLGDNSMSLSLSGGILGTPAYIAPEVWELDAADAPADIYALGCIIYEVLTGEVLFQSKTPMQAVRAHDQGPKYAEAWPEGTPDGLAAALNKTLARDPTARYPTAGTFWHALNALEAEAETARQAAQLAAVAAQWRAETESAMQAGEWSAAKLTLGRWLKVAPGDTAVIQAQQQIEAAIAEQARKQHEAEQERQRLLTEQEQQKQAKADVTTETTRPRAETGTTGRLYAQQGIPDTSENRIKNSMPASVTPVMPAKSAPDQNSQAWKWLTALAALIICALIISSLGKGLTSTAKQNTAVLNVQNTVAASTILLTSTRTPIPPSATSTSTRTPTSTPFPTNTRSPTSTNTPRPTATPRPATATPQPTSTPKPTVVIATNTPDVYTSSKQRVCNGREVYYAYDHNRFAQIYVKYPDGSVIQLTDAMANDSYPTWSPDCRYIAFQSDRPMSNVDVYVMNADGSNVRNVTNLPGHEEYPYWISMNKVGFRKDGASWMSVVFYDN